MQLIHPQPKKGKPFRIAFINRGDEYWYNENSAFPRRSGRMLFVWRCPYGVRGEPRLIDNLWYWVSNEELRAP